MNSIYKVFNLYFLSKTKLSNQKKNVFFRRLFIISWCVINCVFLCSPKKGTIVDNNNNRIPKASILLEDSVGNILKYIYSDNNGFFLLDSVPQDAICMVIRALGYDSKILSTDSIKDGIIVELQSKPTMLKEFIVKANRGSQEGDTINYFVSSFAKDNDHTISDVLKRMPGIDVQENGKILFNGKAISEFQVENMNLAGSKYVQISENLRADNVATVQILQNNQPIKMLKDINFSEDVAINLILKNDFKNSWNFGFELGVGAGTDIKAKDEVVIDSKIMGLMFGKRLQSLSLYKYNNSGKNIAKEIKGNSNIELFSNEQQSIVQPSSFISPNFDKQRYRFNRTHIVTSNWLFKLKNEAEFRVNLGVGIDNNKASLDRETTYLTIEAMPTISESSFSGEDANNLYCELAYKLNTDAKYIENKTEIEFLKNTTHENLLLNSISSDNIYKVSHSKISNKLSMSWKLQNQNIINVDFIARYQDLPEEVRGLETGINQVSKQRNFNADLSGDYSFKTGCLSISFKPRIKFEYSTISIIGSSSSIPMLKHQIPSYDFTSHLNPKYSVNEDNNYRFLDVSLTPKIEYIAPKIKMWANCIFSYKFYSLGKKYNTNTNRHRYFKTMPNAGIQYSPTNKLRLGTTYGYRWQGASILDLIKGPYMVNPTRWRENTGTFYNSSLHSIYTYFNYTDIVSGWNASINYSYSSIRGIPMSVTRLEDAVCIVSKTQFKNKLRTHLVSARIGKIVSFMNLDVAFKPDFFQSNTKVILGESIANQKTNGINLSMILSFQPLNWLDIIYMPQFYNTWNRIASIENLRFKDSGWRNKLSASLKIRKISIVLDNEWINPVSNNLTNCFFSDIKAEYRIRRYFIGAEINNIFNTKQYNQIFMDPSLLQTLTTPLRGREFLVKFSMDI